MKRLTISETDKKLFGVCGGLAEYLEVDSTVVRVVTVVLAIATAFIPVAAAYLFAWLIMPRKPLPPTGQ
ncbi:MAG: DNA-binding transcriptional activator PspC [Bacteroidetes bacterium]|jgi:phage shock protein C|nr:DNA-binding transcriptional activator PspC [Bacteroidota bacterium]